MTNIKKVKWIDDDYSIFMTKGKVYDVIGIEKGWYRIIDNTGEDYLYPPESFEIVS